MAFDDVQLITVQWHHCGEQPTLVAEGSAVKAVYGKHGLCNGADSPVLLVIPGNAEIQTMPMKLWMMGSLKDDAGLA